MAPAASSALTEPLLERCRERAAGYDRDNRFCQEDFDELKAAGYLLMAVPKEFGGAGLTLAEVARNAPPRPVCAATALCINMHNYWVGRLPTCFAAAIDPRVAAARGRGGRGSRPARRAWQRWPACSTTKAERVDGGYKLTGRKAFGSLSPVWTRLGGHSMDTSDPAAPKIVHFFMPRDTKGYTIKDTWDVMGMRATRSDDTVLDGAFVPDKYIGRVVPAGAAGADMFVIGFFTWALVNFANIYYAIGLRTREVLIEQLKTKPAGAFAVTTPTPRCTAWRRSQWTSRRWGRMSKRSPPTGPKAALGLTGFSASSCAPHRGGRARIVDRARPVGRDVQEDESSGCSAIAARQVPSANPLLTHEIVKDLARITRTNSPLKALAPEPWATLPPLHELNNRLPRSIGGAQESATLCHKDRRRRRFRVSGSPLIARLSSAGHVTVVFRAAGRPSAREDSDGVLATRRHGWRLGRRGQ
jgi:hypothetical protein